jgi:hypothetical protein
MTETFLNPSRLRTATGISALAVASILLTIGFACAVPLAAFAAIAAIAFNRREALVAIGAVWLANQTWGFAFMHYPTDAETFAWGGALGIVALLSCEASGLTMRRLPGIAGACTTFLVTFLVYEGSLIAIDLAIGQSVDDFAAATVMRIFLINVCAFGVLMALKSILTNNLAGLRIARAFAPRHV